MNKSLKIASYQGLYKHAAYLLGADDTELTHFTLHSVTFY